MDEQKPTEGVPTPPPEAPKEEYTPYQPAASAPAGYRDEGWSWGAAMISAPFLLGTRNYVYLLLYLLMLIPVVNFFAWIAIFFFLGFKGRDLAKTSTTFSNQDEYRGFMKAFDHAGKILFFIMLGFFVLGIVLFIMIGSAMYGMGDRDDWRYMDDDMRVYEMQLEDSMMDDSYFDDYR